MKCPECARRMIRSPSIPIRRTTRFGSAKVPAAFSSREYQAKFGEESQGLRCAFCAVRRLTRRTESTCLGYALTAGG